MKQIAATDHYTIVVDTSKNRVFMSLKGNWTNVRDVAEFTAHLCQALGMCSPGFTVLNDMSGLRASTLTDLFATMTDILIEGGVGNVAGIFGKAEFARIQVVRAVKDKKFRSKVFDTPQAAQAWLDKK